MYLVSNDQWTTAVLDEIATVPAVVANASLGFTVSVVLGSNGEAYALNAGGFNVHGVGTIQQATFTTEAQNRCSSDAS